MSPEAVEILSAGDVAVSAETVWEVTRKARMRKLPMLPPHVAADLPRYLRGQGFRLLPLSPEAARSAALLPSHHADPMDGFLIAQALAEGATVLTNDRAFAAYGVRTLW